MSKYRFPFFFFSINFNRSRKRDESDEVYDSKFCETILKIFQLTFNDYNDSSQKIRNSFLFFTIYVPFSNIRYSKRRRAERTKIWHIKSIEIIPICIYNLYVYVYLYV